MKVAFDYYGVVSHHEPMQDLVRKFAEAGIEVHCITAAAPETTQEEQVSAVSELGLPFSQIHVVWAPTHSDAGHEKARVMRENGIDVLFDDNPEIIQVILSYRLIGIKV